MNPILNKCVFLAGKRIILRPLSREKDLEAMVKWMNDCDVRHYLTVGLFPTTKEEQEEWMGQHLNNTQSREVVLGIETKEGELIGTINLHDINWVDRTAKTGTIIGNKKYWGQGYGTEAKMILLGYAFDDLGLRKISSSVISFNKRSLNYNLKCGYKIEGVRKRQRFKNGRYYDEICLAVFRRGWVAARGRLRRKGML